MLNESHVSTQEYSLHLVLFVRTESTEMSTHITQFVIRVRILGAPVCEHLV